VQQAAGQLIRPTTLLRIGTYIVGFEAKAFEAGELRPKILGQAFDDLGSPILGLLSIQNVRPMDQYSKMSSRLTANAART